jgi:hypothetical protein
MIGGMAGGALAGISGKFIHASEPELKAGDIPMRVFGKTGVKLTVFI